MAAIDTKELFDLFFSSEMEQKAEKKVRAQVDRPEVYAFEKKIGKQIFDMNNEELMEMLSTFKRSKASTSPPSFTSFTQILSLYRSIWNYYIDNYQIIKNPWFSKDMRGQSAYDKIYQNRDKFSKERLFGVIKKLHDNRPQFTADYLECILLLFYCGVPKSQDIAQITEQTIDFEKKQILVDGRRVQLSDRCFELLQMVHKTTSTVNDRGTFSVVQWHDSYFRFIIRIQTESTFQDMTLSQVGSLINRRISYDINYSLGEDITSRNVYYLGFYDHLVEKYGKEKIRDVIITGKNSENTALLLAEAEECGVYVDNPTHLKNSLQQFV